MENFAEKISLLRESTGKNQQEFARDMGVTARTQRNYEAGKSLPNAEYIAALARNKFDVVKLLTAEAYTNEVVEQQSAADEVCEVPASYRVATDTVEIPVYDVLLSAGHGAALQDEQIIDTYTYKKGFVRQIGCDPEHLAIAFVRGDSMEPTLFHDDLTMYDTRVRWFIDEGVYALRYDDHLMVKRLARRLDGNIEIVSDNKKRYDSMVVTPDMQHCFSILGYLVHFSRGNKTCYRPQLEENR